MNDDHDNNIDTVRVSLTREKTSDYDVYSNCYVT
jgi:hypothetical protein